MVYSDDEGRGTFAFGDVYLFGGLIPVLPDVGEGVAGGEWEFGIEKGFYNFDHV